jgi:hypothetical protein
MLRYDAINQNDNNIYVNVQVVNKSEEPKVFNYYDKRSSSLIQSGFDYKLAVVRLEGLSQFDWLIILRFILLFILFC